MYYILLRLLEILLLALVVSVSAVLIIYQKREKRFNNSALVINLFKERNITQFIDQTMNAKRIGDDLEFVGLNLSRQSYTIIKLYCSICIPLVYFAISISIIEKINHLSLVGYSLAMFIIIFSIPDMCISGFAKLIQNEMRFEFINFLGGWARNLQLGGNFISSISKAGEITRGPLRIQIKKMLDNINASTPIETALVSFGQGCRDREIQEFCNSMALDIREGADMTNYIIETSKRIQSEKANIINANTQKWMVALSTLTGFLIFASFSIYLMLEVLNNLV